MQSIRIEPMRAEHAEAVLAIYQAGLDTRNASFETQAPEWPTWERAHLAEHRFVAVDAGPQGGDGDDEVLGWVACSPTSSRCVYAGVVEESIYIATTARGRGIGRALLDALIESTEATGIWTIQSGIFPENAASLALHERAGFRVIGTRERVGEHFGRWRDVVLVERRSSTVGR
ncbi:MAG: GNAT family N-acetyltransferase [Acidothermaceae bacterium]